MRREDIERVRVLLAIDESAASQEAVHEVLRRLWPADTTVRVLHVVEKFVPPAQELWYDAGGNLDQARQEIKARFRSLVLGGGRTCSRAQSEFGDMDP